MCTNPISITDALTYADHFGFDDKRAFLAVIHAADEVFLKYAAEQQARKT